MLQYIKSEDPQ